MTTPRVRIDLLPSAPQYLDHVAPIWYARSKQARGRFVIPDPSALGTAGELLVRDRAAIPEARVEVVGCPKLDTLTARAPGPGPVVAVAFHWDGAMPELRWA